MLIDWDDDQLEEAGIDKVRLAKLVRKLEKCGQEMKAMGLHMYGASGHGCLIHETRPTHTERGRSDQGSVVASLQYGHWDGGDW